MTGIVKLDRGLGALSSLTVLGKMPNYTHAGDKHQNSSLRKLSDTERSSEPESICGVVKYTARAGLDEIFPLPYIFLSKFNNANYSVQNHAERAEQFDHSPLSSDNSACQVSDPSSQGSEPDSTFVLIHSPRALILAAIPLPRDSLKFQTSHSLHHAVACSRQIERSGRILKGPHGSQNSTTILLKPYFPQ